MQRFGAYLVLLGIGSALLSMTDYQFRLLMWMDDMGNNAWLVRALMVVVGVIMIGVGSNQAHPQQMATAAARAPQPQGYAPAQPQHFVSPPAPAQPPATPTRPAPPGVTEF